MVKVRPEGDRSPPKRSLAKLFLNIRHELVIHEPPGP
jgi:hypothetical protein